ncbi:hypothetical protein FJZ20_01565 [Candidatus Pacearchaeota archaeon]|nr:hypothetical protein [Candidatus Pacearchaeota archaeon]
MNLAKKKELAMRTFGVGRNRIFFVKSRFDEIKEAITKQDMRDLQKDGAIIIKEIKGRKTLIRKKRKKGAGNVRKKVGKRKKEYVILTRKLRKYVNELKSQGKISKEISEELRKKIRNRVFRSKNHLRGYLAGVKK